MTGEQCFGSILDLYDVAGGIRNRLMSLQDAVIKAQSKQTAP